METIESIPDQPGLVVRVHSDSKYPEIWVASYINGGRWYPDTDSWAQHVRGPLDDGGAHLDDLFRRGRVVLLVAGDPDVYQAGWQAGTRHLADLAENAFYDCPTPPEAGDRT